MDTNQRLLELLPHISTMIQYIDAGDAQQLTACISTVLSNALREMELRTADLRRMIQPQSPSPLPPPAAAAPKKTTKKRKNNSAEAAKEPGGAVSWNPELHGAVIHITNFVTDCNNPALYVLTRQNGRTPYVATRHALAHADLIPEQRKRMIECCLAYFLAHPLDQKDEILFRGLVWGDIMLAAIHARDYFVCDAADCGRDFKWQDAGYTHPLSHDPTKKAYCGDCLKRFNIDPSDVLTAEKGQ